MYSPHYNEHPLIKKNIFNKLMHLSTQGMFLYDNRLYQQINGIAMGCSLTPRMANLFLGHVETKMLQKQTPDCSKIYV